MSDDIKQAPPPPAPAESPEASTRRAAEAIHQASVDAEDAAAEREYTNVAAASPVTGELPDPDDRPPPDAITRVIEENLRGAAGHVARDWQQVQQANAQIVAAENNTAYWTRLRQENPAEWTAQRQELQMAKERVAAEAQRIQGEHQRLVAAAGEEVTRRQDAELAAEQRALDRAIPDFGPELIVKLRDFAIAELGYTHAEVDGIRRAKDVITLYKAWKSGQASPKATEPVRLRAARNAEIAEATPSAQWQGILEDVQRGRIRATSMDVHAARIDALRGVSRTPSRAQPSHAWHPDTEKLAVAIENKPRRQVRIVKR
jgi:hypothetical protein